MLFILLVYRCVRIALKCEDIFACMLVIGIGSLIGIQAAKRFKLTGTGKLKRNKAYKRHILTKKTTKTKRNLRKPAMTDKTNVKNMKKILPYM